MNTKPFLLNVVQDQYGAVARSNLSNESAAVRSVAQAFGYSAEELASLPPQANMGLSCGNPVAIAGLRPGEVVLDLGCGGGLDVLLAAKRVGPHGKAIGIDLTPDMIARAKAGAAQVGATNVEFHLAPIHQLPLPDASVDCVISNCVINLVPDKSQAFGEILRVLKPGGRLVVSDIALQQPLPAEIVRDVHAYVGCIAGAISIAEYERLLREAGFDTVVVQETGANLNAYAEAAASESSVSGRCCSADATAATGSPLHDRLAEVLRQFDANAYAASVRVHALKPNHSSMREATMNTIQIFDKPMCCSTGVCGPEVDPVLPQFAADLQWLKSQGPRVERFNLAQQPEAFVQNSAVQQLLATHGVSCLPVIVVNGEVVSRQLYPTRDQLIGWMAGKQTAPTGCCGGPAQDPRQACCKEDEKTQAAAGVGCGCQSTGCC